jgi:hypothetical protein
MRISSFGRRVAGTVAAGSAAAMALVCSAMAEIPADVSSATADLKTDGSSIATTVLAATAVVFAIKFLRRGF